MAVYRYAQTVTERGLVVMDAPGYDPMGTTGQIASGANVIAFTTGGGSCFGAKPVPSLKIATNSKLFKRMEDDMDINCGDVIASAVTLEQKGEEIYQALLRLASGEKSKSDSLGAMNEESVPWMVGAQM
jgi:altronate hydrolase